MSIPDGLVSADRVKQTSTDTGSGNLALGAAVSVKFTTAIVAGIALNTPFAYTIEHQGVGVGEWEVGYGRLVDATTLQRDTVTASSNAGALVNFSAGVKHVAITFTSDMLADILAEIQTGVRGVAYGGTGANLSATSGLLRQASVGANFTATHLQAGDVPNSLISSDMLAANAVVTAKILDANVTADKLAANAVTQTKILDGAVTTSKINDSAVTDVKLATSSVTDAKIVSMTASKLLGDIAIARMQAALAAGGYPISATTGTFSGNVQIGPTAAGTQLELSAASGTDVRATVRAAGANAIAGVRLISTTATVPHDWLIQAEGSNGRFRIYDNAGSVGEWFTILQSGIVGIGGIPSTGYKLHVQDGPVGVGTTNKAYIVGDYGGSGEIGAGALIGTRDTGNFGFFPSIENVTAGLKIAMGYYSGTLGVKSAAEIANVASGLSELKLMKGGGFVNINNTGAATAALDISSDILRLRTSKTPASAAAAGNQGDICWDSSYVYVCTATNTWKRVALATW